MKTPLGPDVEVSPRHINNLASKTKAQKPVQGILPPFVLKEGKIRFYICICEYVPKETVGGKKLIDVITFGEECSMDKVQVRFFFLTMYIFILFKYLNHMVWFKMFKNLMIYINRI